MSNIGILIETGEDGVKEANLALLLRREAVGTLKFMPLL